ncbi:MAG TPA: DUF4331 family protein [Candidatus Tumulicola sp.]|jgi:hypothetical protein
MSHHFAGPDFGFPGGDARFNFTDLYAFPKPGDNSKSILIMNVHPSFGVNPPGPTPIEPFASNALYEILIDTDGDAIVNIAYSVKIMAAPGSGQVATLRRIEGDSLHRTGDDGEIVADGVAVSTGGDSKVMTAGDIRFFAGRRSDPFFFDAAGAINNLTFTGDDFFIDKNVASVILEVPNAALGSDSLKIWARTVDGSSGSWKQVDRGARASQVPFLAGDQKAAYITAEPANDAQFVATFAHSLEHAGGYTPEEAARVASGMLPDLQPYRPGSPASYPTNGRALTDDVSAYFLGILTNGKVTSDGLSPHKDLMAEFPYLGPPHGG